MLSELCKQLPGHRKTDWGLPPPLLITLYNPPVFAIWGATSIGEARCFVESVGGRELRLVVLMRCHEMFEKIFWATFSILNIV